MFSTQDVVRLSDRWFDPAHPDAISRQGRLESCIVLVTLFHIVMSIAFMKVDEYERKHAPRRIIPSDLEFVEFMIAPPELKHVKLEQPTPVALIESKDNDTGGKSGGKEGSKNAAAELKSDNKDTADNRKLTVNTTELKKEALAPDPPKDTSAELSRKNESATQDQLAFAAPTGEIVNPNAPIDVRGSNGGGGETDDEQIGQSQGRDGSSSGGGENELPPGSERPKAAHSNIGIGDIHPYHKELLYKISQEWEAPTKKAVRLLVLIDVQNDGKLISAGVIESSGNAKVDKQALEAVRRTAFDPFPDWCRRAHLRFKVELKNF